MTAPSVTTCFCSRPEEQTPCHSSFPRGIISGPHRASFPVRDHLWRCTDAMLLPLGGAPITNMVACRKVQETSVISFADKKKRYWFDKLKLILLLYQELSSCKTSNS